MLAVGIRSNTVRPTAAQIASALQPAWHLTSARPSSPSAIDRLARRSSWAGQRADQPLPDCLASGSFARIRSTGVIAAPFPPCVDPSAQVIGRVSRPVGRSARRAGPAFLQTSSPTACEAKRLASAPHRGHSTSSAAFVTCSCIVRPSVLVARRRPLKRWCPTACTVGVSRGRTKWRVAKRQRPDKCQAADNRVRRLRIAAKSIWGDSGPTNVRPDFGFCIVRRQVE